MENITVPDQRAREQALDPWRSFIVQAPAGSGKTELLTQRYLVLLAHAQHSPEEILAITFTKKAAAEMRTRIIAALQHAASQPRPATAHAARTWQLAQTVLTRDKTAGWNLLHNPQLLRIQTIDGFCLGLACSMPILSGFGAKPLVADDSEPYYTKAVHDFLTTLETDAVWADALADLLWHLGNDVTRVTQLLIQQLKERDSWLPYVMAYRNAEGLREYLETALANMVSVQMAALLTHFPPHLVQEFLTLLRFAASHVPADNPLAACGELTQLPAALLENQTCWQNIANFLLTKEKQWRRRVDMAMGFPAPSAVKDKQEQALFKEMKTRMQRLLEALSAVPALEQALATFLITPTPHYEESQWKILSALLTILPYLVAHLKVVFKEAERVDFIEIAEAALRALGNDDSPTDLALALDCQIQHILIDEFQDTSVSQYRLFEALTRGWLPEDGHSLFLVGDPMQSIYKFRQAEVGLFLKARDQGLGEVRLTPLLLTSNFRSDDAVVNTINSAFTVAMPTQENMTSGAICYRACQAVRQNDTYSGVNLHGFLKDNKVAEANKIVEIIETARAEKPDGTIAILVRARSHLTAILPALQAAGIDYSAIEIELLAEKMIIYDLMALTQALLDLTDRTAWLAVLRAPWCGLTLTELANLTANDNRSLLIELLQDAEKIALLSHDGQTRLQRILPALLFSIQQRYRYSLRDWVYNAWLAMQGPQCIHTKTALQQAETYFTLLEELDETGVLPTVNRLSEKVARLFALPVKLTAQPVQIMTIHKAKGLEFDTVILPGLNGKLQEDKAKLLKFLEVPITEGRSQLLMAPIKARDDSEASAIYTYLQKYDAEKTTYEKARLLYVAMTRAKRKLHLLASFANKEEITATPGSLLETIWPYVKTEYATLLPQSAADTAPAAVETVAINRLSLSAINPIPLLSSQWPDDNVPDYTALDETATIIGKVMHLILQKLSVEGLEQWEQQISVEYCKCLLRFMGLKEIALPTAVEILHKGISNTLTDTRGRWLFSSHHTEVAVELPLSMVVKGAVQQVILDKTFIDEKNQRWIIDYKTSTLLPEETVADFLQREQQQYRPQLEKYAAVMKQIDRRDKVFVGLYFPLPALWCEWTI